MEGLRPAKLRRRFGTAIKIFFPLLMRRAFKTVLFARQQNGKHGFLDVETVLRLVKDLVRVLLEQGGGDLLAPVGGQTVQHQRVRLGVFQQTAGELEAHKIPQTLLALGSAGGGGVCLLYTSPSPRD